MDIETVDIAIIGAGLSGIYAATRLAPQKQSFVGPGSGIGIGAVAGYLPVISLTAAGAKGFSRVDNSIQFPGRKAKIKNATGRVECHFFRTTQTLIHRSYSQGGSAKFSVTEQQVFW